jgi:hypothetical protein
MVGFAYRINKKENTHLGRSNWNCLPNLNIYKDGIFTTYDKLQKALGLFKVE